MEFLFLAALTVCMLVILYYGAGCRRADEINGEAQRLMVEIIPAERPDVSQSEVPETIPCPEAAPEEEITCGIDLSGLREVNADVVSWIEIPGVLSYPVMQGTDNGYYLSHAWNREENAAGAIFLDYRASAGYEGFNTVIYGHRMRNETMFGMLKHYNDPIFLAAHPCIYLSDESGIREYAVYAAYEVSPTGIAYQLEFSNAADKQEFIQYGIDHSTAQTGIIPTAEDSIITLSTCTGNGHSTRWVVQALFRSSN